MGGWKERPRRPFVREIAFDGLALERCKSGGEDDEFRQISGYGAVGCARLAVDEEGAGDYCGRGLDGGGGEGRAVFVKGLVALRGGVGIRACQGRPGRNLVRQIPFGGEVVLNLGALNRCQRGGEDEEFREVGGN